MKLSNILDLIDSGDIALPEFQRGYVWNREQVRGLLQSLYRGYPVGSLLTWHTKAEGANARGGTSASDGHLKLLLDGQQRITTLYGIIRGRAPKFFDGNPATFTGLHFHLDDEVFEFYAPSKMSNDPTWVDVTKLMRDGIAPFLQASSGTGDAISQRTLQHINRLNQIAEIRSRDFHVDEVTGEDKTLDIVVDVFNRVNSGGTKLSKGDLALARVCAAWPEARQDMNQALAKWRGYGFSFRLDWLLRVTNAVLTGEAMFAALADVSAAQFKDALKQSIALVGTLLDSVAARLGFDHDRVLAGRYAFPVMARYLAQRGGSFPSMAEQDRLLYWYVHAFLWGRYAGSVETVLNQDLKAVDGGGIEGLITQLQLSRPDLRVRPEDFAGHSVGARFYPMLYLLTRVFESQDFCSGLPLKAHLLGKNSSLEIHHIFPKKLLYQNGYLRSQVNAVANFCFLTKDCNIKISASHPTDYFSGAPAGALESQWVPTDESLWSIDRYPDFLAARRRLLADKANSFLDTLQAGEAPASRQTAPTAATTVADAEPDDATDQVNALAAWAAASGFAAPDRDVELVDPHDGSVIGTAEAAWPRGLQEGLGEPIVLDLELDEAIAERLSALGIRAFASPALLREFVEREPVTAELR